jgi:hypothetical protein
MRKVFFGCLVLVLAGCGRDEITYRPHFDRTQAPPAKAEPAAAKPKRDPNEKISILEKVEDVDVRKYGIPTSPGAMLADGQKWSIGPDKKVLITLQSYDSVRSAAEWYKTRIEATEAVGDSTFASLKGTTTTNYPLEMTVLDVEGKLMISITVDTKSNK